MARLGEQHPPIRAYGIIGDCHTAALISRDGSIDWYCPGRFDSSAVFCRILDLRKGGYLSLAPAARFSTERRYMGATNLLETTFRTDGGVLRVVDFMPIEPLSPRFVGYDVGTMNAIVRIVECVEGAVDVALSFKPTFDFAAATTSLRVLPGEGVVAEGDGQRLGLSARGFELEQPVDGVVEGSARLAAGERLSISLAPVESASGPPEHRDTEADLEGTLDYWQRWADRCTYDGPYRDQVLRSALALKLLDHEPSGALVAAPTTSLPEEIGGVRNWDYRFTWLRDSALVLYALHLIGYHDEAVDFFGWLERLCLGQGGVLQIMYGVDGEPNLPERILDHLDGYRGSRPVRIGNEAASQVQLDIFGEVLDAAHLSLEGLKTPIRPELWGALSFLADAAATRWHEPDWGIWEVRGGPRHFLYSKLLCWVAVDRAISLAEGRGLEGDVDGWKAAREEIRETILTQGYDEDVGAFTQVLGEPALDASALMIPLVGFLPPTDPRVRSTVQRIQERLTSDGLVYRYLTEDGLPGGEATFTLCTFWLVDNLSLAGRTQEARALFEKVVAYANDLGLLSEEIHPGTGELLGNFPQGFTHLGLIRAALHIAKAEARGSEEQPERPAERMGRTERAGAAGADEAAEQGGEEEADRAARRG